MLFAGCGAKVCQHCLQEGWCWYEQTCRRTHWWWGDVKCLILIHFLVESLISMFWCCVMVYSYWTTSFSSFLWAGGACCNHYAKPSSVQDPWLVPQQAKGYQGWQVLTGMENFFFFLHSNVVQMFFFSETNIKFLWF